MKKWIILIVVMLMFASQSYAWKDSFNVGEEVIIEDTIETAGLSQVCNITIYQNSTLIQTANMTRNGLAYSYNAGIAGTDLEEDYYVCAIECTPAANPFLGECNFVVEGRMTIFFILLFLVSIVIAAGFINHNYIFDIFAGILLILFGLMFLSGEIVGLSDFYNNGVGISIAFIGFYFIFIGLFSMVKRRKLKKEEKRQRKEDNF